MDLESIKTAYFAWGGTSEANLKQNSGSPKKAVRALPTSVPQIAAEMPLNL